MFGDDVKRISMLNNGLNKAKILHKKTNNSEYLKLIKRMEDKILGLDKQLIVKINCSRCVYKKDYDFLNEINTKICSYNEINFTRKKFVHIIYNDYKITNEEFVKIEKLLSTGNFILYPIITNFNFTMGYCLYDIEKKKVVLNFLDKHLPPEINFEKISEYIFSEKNLQLAEENEIHIFENKKE